MKTTAAVLRSASSPLRLEELDIGPLRPDELVVRMVSSGICHTDLGVIASAAADEPPIVLGHEGAGVVTQVGSAVTTIAPGDHVVLSYNFCGRCDNCTAGLPMHCRHFMELNFTGARGDGTTPLHNDAGPVLGAFFGQSSWSTFAVATQRCCVKVDPELPLALLGPLGCGIQTGAGAVLNTLKPAPGSSIAVFGVGSVGLAAVLAAVAAGCSPIIVVDIDDSALSKARQLGATHIVNSSSSDPVGLIRDLTGGRGVQYTVDCIALPVVARAAIESLQAPGTCASVGFQGPSNNITVNQGHLLFGRTVIGVIEGDAVAAMFIPRLLKMYREGRFPFDRIIDTFAFADINEAIAAVRRGATTKAVLTYSPNDGSDA